MNENVLMLIVNDSACTERGAVALGTINIDKVLEHITDAEIKQMGGTWQRSKFATVLAAKAATMAKGEEGFTLDQVKGDLKITKALTLAPFETTHVMTQSRVKGHRKRVNVITEPPDKNFIPAIVTNPGYAFLKPGSNRISVSVRNLTDRTVTLKPKTVVAKLAAANVVPPKLAPKSEESPEDTDQERKPLSEEMMKELFPKLDLSGIENWEETEKESELSFCFGRLRLGEDLHSKAQDKTY